MRVHLSPSYMELAPKSDGWLGICVRVGAGPKCWCDGMAVIKQAALVSELVLRG